MNYNKAEDQQVTGFDVKKPCFNRWIKARLYEKRDVRFKR